MIRAAHRGHRLALGVRAACALAWFVAGGASAQSTTSALDDSGQWVQTRAPEPGSDEEIVARARGLLADGRAREAKHVLDAWLDAHEETDNPWLADAYLVRGDARTASDAEYWALYDYEEICKHYRASDAFPTAVEREFDIGKRYLNGLKTKIFWVRIESATAVGEELMLRVQERLPGSVVAEKACLELADYYYRTRQLAAAADAYDVFLQLYPKSEMRPKAMQRRVYANIAKFKGPKYDAGGLIEAKYLIRSFADRYPAEAERAGMSDALVSRLDESAGAQMLDVAKWYFTRGDEVSAKLTLERLQRRHPQTVAASRGRDLMIQHGWTTPTVIEPRASTPPAEEGSKPGAPETAPADQDRKEPAPSPAQDPAPTTGDHAPEDAR